MIFSTLPVACKTCLFDCCVFVLHVKLVFLIVVSLSSSPSSLPQSVDYCVSMIGITFVLVVYIVGTVIASVVV
jgi:hypothetical protein